MDIIKRTVVIIAFISSWYVEAAEAKPMIRRSVAVATYLSRIGWGPFAPDAEFVRNLATTGTKSEIRSTLSSYDEEMAEVARCNCIPVVEIKDTIMAALMHGRSSVLLFPTVEYKRSGRLSVPADFLHK